MDLDTFQSAVAEMAKYATTNAAVDLDALTAEIRARTHENLAARDQGIKDAVAHTQTQTKDNTNIHTL